MKRLSVVLLACVSFSVLGMKVSRTRVAKRTLRTMRLYANGTRYNDELLLLKNGTQAPKKDVIATMNGLLTYVQSDSSGIHKKSEQGDIATSIHAKNMNCEQIEQCVATCVDPSVNVHTAYNVLQSAIEQPGEAPGDKGVVRSPLKGKYLLRPLLIGFQGTFFVEGAKIDLQEIQIKNNKIRTYFLDCGDFMFLSMEYPELLTKMHHCRGTVHKDLILPEEFEPDTLFYKPNNIDAFYGCDVQAGFNALGAMRGKKSSADTFEDTVFALFIKERAKELGYAAIVNKIKASRKE